MGNCCQKDNVDEEYIKAALTLHVADYPAELLKGPKGKPDVHNASSGSLTKAKPLKIFNTHLSPKNGRLKKDMKTAEVLTREKSNFKAVNPQLCKKANSCLNILKAKGKKNPSMSGFFEDNYLHASNYDNDHNLTRSASLKKHHNLCLDVLKLPTIRLQFEANIFRCENNSFITNIYLHFN